MNNLRRPPLPGKLAELDPTVRTEWPTCRYPQALIDLHRDAAPLTRLDRACLTALVAWAQDSDAVDEYRIPTRTLALLASESNASRIKATIGRLASMEMMTNIHGTVRGWNKRKPVALIRLAPTGRGSVAYTFFHDLAEQIVSPSQYATLELGVVADLKTAYGAALYPVIATLAGRSSDADNVHALDATRLAATMGYTAGSLRLTEFRRCALEPALADIRSNGRPQRFQVSPRVTIEPHLQKVAIGFSIPDEFRRAPGSIPPWLMKRRAEERARTAASMIRTSNSRHIVADDDSAWSQDELDDIYRTVMDDLPPHNVEQPQKHPPRSPVTVLPDHPWPERDNLSPDDPLIGAMVDHRIEAERRRFGLDLSATDNPIPY